MPRTPGYLGAGITVAVAVACAAPAEPPGPAPRRAQDIAVGAPGALVVTALQVDHLTSPLGIDDPRPTLSWKLSAADRGAYPAMYRVLVATAIDRLAPGAADVWDSGVVVEDAPAARYGGPPLGPAQRYYWTVQVGDASGNASAWSAPGQWEMGLLAPPDWRGARWIRPGATGDSAPRLRRGFTLDARPIARARAYVVGLGFYELHINGAKVGDRVLAQASTPYERRTLYATYDVTGILHPGANAVGLWLGNGYGARFSPFGFRWLGPAQAIVLIDVTFSDGSHQAIPSDTAWRWSTGPITANDLYAGETYDARLEQAGWDRAEFDDAGWQPALFTAPPEGALVADAMPPIRVVQTLGAVAITQPRTGIYVYDFGQNIAGWARLRVRGPAGTTVRMRTAEELGGDGMLDTTTNRDAAATDVFVLAGTGALETYEPRFTYHGFRYVEVTGFPGAPGASSLEARVVHADVASIGAFASSDPLLDQIWRNNRRAILNNAMSTPTDNPVRDERTPPGMDVQAYHDASTREFDLDAFYVNYLRDMPPGTALPSDAGNAQQPDMGGDQITLAWALYEQYGNLAILAELYPAMTAFVDRNATDVPGLIWTTGFGDWCPPDHSASATDGTGGPSAGDCTSEVSLVNTALSYRQASAVARAATALGRTGDAARYAQLAERIQQAFQARFVGPDGASYGDGRQVTSVLPLAFGMVPEARVRAVGTRLVETILDDNAGHLDTGIFGTRYLVDALAGIGRIDVAMTILDQTSYPGFGFEIARGATTPWEEWTYFSSMETHDHAMFAGINASLYTQLAGIQPTSPGYRTVTIAPQLPPGLPHVEAAIDTVRGPIASAWTVSGGQLALDVGVPVGTTATVRVPAFGAGNASVTPADGAVLAAATGTDTTYVVGSGTWHFTGSPAPPASATPPGTWTRCARETETCAFSGVATVAYGARGQFRYATVTDGISCSNAAFGDPVPGVHKVCYVQALPQSSAAWARCADETSACAFTGVATVAYGAAGRFSYATVANGTACSNAMFGDPIPGTRKACYVIAAPPTATMWSPCAGEARACTFSGSHLVAYGAAGRYAYGTFTGGTPCSNAVFGDPAPGMAKICYVQ